MKITYLKLENFTGIYNGTGEQILELDFSNSFFNLITLLSGMNGSGKSTLMSTLHPFANTIDGKSSFILNGMDGSKEIHIQNDNHLYKIKHLYLEERGKKKTKSYIAKKDVNKQSEWKELNPNGTVGTFKELVEKELDVDESFFRLSSIGSDTASFINMTTAKRKEYLSKFLPDVDRYLEAYKTINTKYQAINKNIKFVTDQINKLESEERLKENLSIFEKRLKELQNEKDELSEKISGNNAIIESLNVGDAESTYNSKLLHFRDIKQNIEELNSIINDYTIDEVDNNIKELSILIAGKESEYNNICSQLSIQQQKLQEEKNNLIDIELELESYNLDDINKDYEYLINNVKDKLDDINDSLSNYSLDDRITKPIIDNIINTLNELTSLQKKYDISDISIQDPTNTIIEYKQTLNNLNTKLQDSKELLIKVKSFEDSASILNKRPENCSIDTCPFIKRSIDSRNKLGDLNSSKVSDKISILENKIKDINITIEDLQDKQSIYNNLSNFYNWKIKDNIEYLNLLNINIYDSKEDFINNFKKDITLIIEELYDKNDYFDLINDRTHYENKLKEYMTDKNNNDKIKTIVNLLTNNKSKIESTISNIEEQIKSYNVKIKEINIEHDKEQLNEFEYIKESINNRNELSLEAKELKEELMKIKDKVAKVRELNKENDELNNNLIFTTKSIIPIEKDILDTKLKLEKIKEYNERKKELEDNYSKLSILRTALSTTKGIPLLFIDVYLKKTKIIANKLLDVTFKGKFYIEDFKLTEKDFFISVRKEDGELVEDVTQASQGEKALLSIALSFALIQQSLKSYNIICLDEIDSTLDANNRRGFIEMIEKQLTSMNVEQCFIISHNESFDTHPVNLILMPGSTVDTNDKEFLSNKNIIKNFNF